MLCSELKCLCVCLQYYHVYKNHQLNTLLSERHRESGLLTRERLDHYHYLCSRAVDLKKQLDEVRILVVYSMCVIAAAQAVDI